MNSTFFYKHPRYSSTKLKIEFPEIEIYEVLDENDVALGIEDIDTSDAANIFTIKTRDGSVFEIETRKIE